MGLDMEFRLLRLLIIFKDWGKKTLEVQNKVLCLVEFFLLSPSLSSSLKKKHRTAINGIPANHLVSLVWRLTDSSPCQSPSALPPLDLSPSLPLSLSLSLSLSHSLTQLPL